MKTELIRQNAGFDVSKDDFKVSLCVMDIELGVQVKGSHSFDNNLSGFKKFAQWVDRKKVGELAVAVTMEATGVYYEDLAYFLLEQHFEVSVVLPSQAKKYIQSLGIKSKTDKIDAQALSRMGLERKLRIWQPLGTIFLQLKQLTREREAIVCERTRSCNQMHAYRHQAKSNQQSINRCLEHIAFLDQHIKEIEKEIADIVRQDEALTNKLKFLLSIPGVGLLTAVIIVAETNGFATISGIKQLTSFAGMDVKLAESGKWKGKSKISKKGNSHIRKALYMSAFSKIQNDEATRNCYQELKQKKGKGMIAAVAIQRKLLGLIYTLWKKEEMFVAA